MGLSGSAESCWVPEDRAGAGSGCMEPSAVSILGFDLGGREKLDRLTRLRTEFPELSERGGAGSGPVSHWKGSETVTGGGSRSREAKLWVWKTRPWRVGGRGRRTVEHN